MSRKLIAELVITYFKVWSFYFCPLGTPWVWLSLHAIDPLMLKWLIEAIKDRPEEYFSELFEIADSLFLFLRVLPFKIKINKIVGILPMLVEQFDVHNIFWLWLWWILSSKISTMKKAVPEDISRCRSYWMFEVGLKANL